MESKALLKNRRKMKFETRRTWTGIIFLVPSAILFIIFVIVPIINVFRYSFNEWNGIDSVPMEFVGFKNYIRVPTTEGFKTMIVATVIFAIGVTILTVVLAFIVALALDNKEKGIVNRRFLRSMWFFPCLLSGLIVGILWNIMYNHSNGVINVTIKSLGGKGVEWLTTPGLTNVAVIVAAVWIMMGLCIVIFLAGLQSIPGELYEAARIDGASRRQIRRSITIPMMAPAITINFLTTSIAAFKMYELPWFISKGLPGYSTRLLTQRIYFYGFETMEGLGTGSALSVILIIVITVISLVQLFVLRRREDIY